MSTSNSNLSMLPGIKIISVHLICIPGNLQAWCFGLPVNCNAYIISFRKMQGITGRDNLCTVTQFGISKRKTEKAALLSPCFFFACNANGAKHFPKENADARNHRL
uniref:Uncharacterized protein n=1 Tax=Hordeum vulgare subsp. vulgare TaxID=112509 RepID=A0A8I6Y0D8_HORVV